MSIYITSQPPQPVLCKNPAFFAINSTIDDATNHMVEVTISNDDDDEMFSDMMPMGFSWATLTRTLAFELSEYFAQYLNPVFTFPDINESPVLASGNFKKLNFSFRELHSTPQVNPDTITLNNFITIYGRIPKYLHNWFYNNWASFNLYLNQTRNFLTFWPSNHKITKAQTEKLYYCNYWFNAGDTLQLYVTLHFSDGTTVEKIPFGDTVEPDHIHQVWEFHVGYNALQLDDYLATNYPTKELTAYTVRICDQNDGNRSTTHNYTLDNKHYQQRREFIFRNPLGGYDTFIATGSAEYSAEYTPENIQVLPWFGITGNSRKTIRTGYEETIVCNSGFLALETFEASPQFFLSDDVYEIIKGKRYPIIFQQQTIIRHTDKHGLHAFQFSYMYAPININETV